jgi:transcriptional regulator with XRE-family HTH domain
VDETNELSQFLTSRRARVTPEQAGLRTFGRRQVQGLRREEVASLAGVSVEYYKRLERGSASGASELVLEGLARALQLDDAERAHLFDLARAANPVTPKRLRPVKQKIRPVVQRMLDQIAAPATASALHRSQRTWAQRHQADPPPDRRRAGLELRVDGAQRRRRREHRDLHARARLGVQARARSARRLVGDAGSGRRAPRNRRARRARCIRRPPRPRDVRHERNSDRWPRQPSLP